MGYSARSDRGYLITAAAEAFDLPTAANADTGPADDAAGTLGDGDGIAEPGETVRLAPTLRVAGATDLTNVSARLTSSTPGVVIGDPVATYGAVAAGGAVAPAKPFAITLPSSLPCGTPVALSLALTSDQGPATVGLTLDTGAGTRRPAAPTCRRPSPTPRGRWRSRR